MTQNLTSHTVIRNEDRYIWFALQSVINFVDQMLIYDTGSTDQTVTIIQSIKSKKIIYEQRGPVDRQQLVDLRQDQLNRTKTDWFLILDGDEVYWQKTIQSLTDLIKSKQNKNLYGIITPTINCIGDIFHHQEEKAGQYRFKDKIGHFAVRAINRRIKGLHLKGTYPLEGYFDNQEKLITDYKEKLIFCPQPYLHLTNLSRSTQKEENVLARKKKYELGISFSKNFDYPEVFYQTRPNIVPPPFVKRKKSETLRAALETPAKLIKRHFFP